ncbi:MAG: phytanoyl-CoA dioxygenase family protein [Pseudomonadales bacterium]|nr:phytanoyl-CoA dioxygenase family protein [Pseudomonadales bacterium]
MLKHFKNKDTISDICQAIAEDGACIVDGLLKEDLCDELSKDFLGDLEKIDWGIDELGYKNEFYGDQTKRLHGLFSRSTHMETVLTHPLLLGVSRQILLADDKARDIRLSNTELMVLNKNQKNQVFHSDAGSWHRVQKREKLEASPGKGEILVSANCALTDFTENNGATRVVPGSHLWEAGREPTEAEICLAIMKKGSALLYSGNVLHSGGENRTDDIRTGLYLGYAISWLRPIENQLVTNKPEDIFALSAKAQQLLDVVPGGFTVIA